MRSLIDRLNESLLDDEDALVNKDIIAPLIDDVFKRYYKTISYKYDPDAKEINITQGTLYLFHNKFTMELASVLQQTGVRIGDVHDYNLYISDKIEYALMPKRVNHMITIEIDIDNLRCYDMPHFDYIDDKCYIVIYTNKPFRSFDGLPNDIHELRLIDNSKSNKLMFKSNKGMPQRIGTLEITYDTMMPSNFANMIDCDNIISYNYYNGNEYNRARANGYDVLNKLIKDNDMDLSSYSLYELYGYYYFIQHINDLNNYSVPIRCIMNEIIKKLKEQ